jgi:hypothetical protein
LGYNTYNEKERKRSGRFIKRVIFERNKYELGEGEEEVDQIKQ